MEIFDSQIKFHLTLECTKTHSLKYFLNRCEMQEDGTDFDNICEFCLTLIALGEGIIFSFFSKLRSVDR